MNTDGFRSIIDQLASPSSKVEMTVIQMGFPDGADLATINRRIQELGYESFPDVQLLHDAKRKHSKIYLGNATFVLKKK
jgi:DNA-binding MurR/RpiR family transcriptional regulator